MLKCLKEVEAYTALWIEINYPHIKPMTVKVEAYTALWIEIFPGCDIDRRLSVEAYTALWIEISLSICSFSSMMSRLIQPCGLKCSLAIVGNQSQVEAYTALWIEIITG